MKYLCVFCWEISERLLSCSTITSMMGGARKGSKTPLDMRCLTGPFPLSRWADRVH